MTTVRKLSGKAIRQALQAGRARMVNDGHGLYLQTTAKGSACWLLRYKRGGRTRYMGLGPLAVVDADEARMAALEAHRLLRRGLDPLAQRDADRAQTALEQATTLSFSQAVGQYLDAHRAGWSSPKHAQQWENTLATYAEPSLGKLPVAGIDTGLVLRVLKPMWETKPETANRVRMRIEKVLGWCTTMGYRAGENPARWKSHLANLLPARSKVRRVKHRPALPYGELPAFFAELRQIDGVAASALAFAILTNPRSGDLTGQTMKDKHGKRVKRADSPPMLWSHVDRAAKLWIVPKTKTGAEHRIPLSAPALAILDHMERLCDPTTDAVFPGLKRGTALSGGAMLRVLKRMGRHDIVAHGFRSTFKTWAGECTNFPHEVIEACMSHVVDDEIERAYRRGDFLHKRRQLMAAWAEFVLHGVAPSGSEVIPLRA
jgi:integrase